LKFTHDLFAASRSPALSSGTPHAACLIARRGFLPEVNLLRLAPGQKLRLGVLIKSGVQGVVLQSYGAGNGPTASVDFVHELKTHAHRLSSQSARGRVSLVLAVLIFVISRGDGKGDNNSDSKADGKAGSKMESKPDSKSHSVDHGGEFKKHKENLDYVQLDGKVRCSLFNSVFRSVLTLCRVRAGC
jgi:hypothetical protein